MVLFELLLSVVTIISGIVGALPGFLDEEISEVSVNFDCFLRMLASNAWRVSTLLLFWVELSSKDGVLYPFVGINVLSISISHQLSSIGTVDSEVLSK